MRAVRRIMLQRKTASFLQIAEQQVDRTFDQAPKFVAEEVHQKRIRHRQRDFYSVLFGNLDRAVRSGVHAQHLQAKARRGADVEALAGRVNEARSTLAALQAMRQGKFVTAYGIALLHAGLGQADEAFAWLEEAMAERSNWLLWLRFDPRWRGFRADRRFVELVRRINFAAV